MGPDLNKLLMLHFNQLSCKDHNINLFNLQQCHTNWALIAIIDLIWRILCPIIGHNMQIENKIKLKLQISTIKALLNMCLQKSLETLYYNNRTFSLLRVLVTKGTSHHWRNHKDLIRTSTTNIKEVISKDLLLN